MMRHNTLLVMSVLSIGVSLSAGRCVAEEPFKSGISQQISRLADLKQQQDAGSKLKAEGSAAVPALIAALNQRDENIRCGALRVLGDIGDPSAIPAMSKIALSDDPLSDIARQCIAPIGGPEAATCLIGMLGRHPLGDEARYISQDLGAIGDNRAVEPLVQLLQGRLIGKDMVEDAGDAEFKIRARAAAAEALANFRDPRSRAALKQAVLDDPDWDVYYAASEALRHIDRPGQDDDWRKLIPMAVEKQPEPSEGAEAYCRQWQIENAGKNAQSLGPQVLDFASPVDIARARAELIYYGRGWPGVVEALMCYMRNRMLSNSPEQSQTLIEQIGESAIPALEIGLKRGDVVLKQHCEECLDVIRAQATKQPSK